MAGVGGRFVNEWAWKGEVDPTARTYFIVEEWAFRTCKTVELEVRPVYVRLASRTRAHVFAVMPASVILRELACRWRDIDLTIEEGIRELETLCVMDVMVKGEFSCHKFPKPQAAIQRLIDAAQVTLPEMVFKDGTAVATSTSVAKKVGSLY